MLVYNIYMKFHKQLYPLSFKLSELHDSTVFFNNSAKLKIDSAEASILSAFLANL